MKNIFLSLIQLLPVMVWSQISGQGGLMSSDYTNINPGAGISMVNGVPVETNKNIYAGVKGSAFLYNDFVRGYVITKDTFNSLENYTYNFDAYKHELHVRYPSGAVKILFNSELRGFQLLDPAKGIAHNFRKLKINSNIYQFYEIIGETAEYSLVKLWERRFVKANPIDRGVVQTGMYDEFMEYEQYFIKIKDGRYQALDKLSKKSFITLLPKQAQQIEKIWKTFKWGRKIVERDIPQLFKALEDNIQK
jgi:hypothetical protein